MTREPAPYTSEELASEWWRPVRCRRQRVSVSSLGLVRNDATGQMLTPHVNGQYLSVYVRTRSVSGVRSESPIHRLVADTLIRPLREGDVVNHLNGCKLDNRRANLEVTTCRGNARHASEAGLVPHGEWHPRAKLTWTSVRAIRERRGEGATALAREFGVSPAAISNILNDLSWVPRPGDPS